MWTPPKLIAIAIVVAMLLVSSFAMAEESVSIEVRTIAASTQGEDFDSRLSSLRSRLERGFAGYSMFRQLGDDTITLTKGASGTLRLPTGDSLTLEYQGMAGNLVKLGLSIGDRLNTTLRATPGSTFFQAGLTYQDGILVLAITVE